MEYDLITPSFATGISKSRDEDPDDSNCETFSEPEPGHIRDNEADHTILAPGQSFQDTAFKLLGLRDMASGVYELQKSFDAYKGSHPTLPNISLTTQDVVRWKMAWRAIQMESEVRSEDIHEFPAHPRQFREPIVQRCKDWPDIFDILDILDKPWVSLGFSAAALIYGGLHALAWFAHFDSSTEQLLWRISACAVMGGIPIIVVSNTLYGMMNRQFSLDDTIRFSLILLVLLVSLACVLAYVLARAYLVVECFINLSHLPAGVYDVPNWATYFPHIS